MQSSLVRLPRCNAFYLIGAEAAACRIPLIVSDLQREPSVELRSHERRLPPRAAKLVRSLIAIQFLRGVALPRQDLRCWRHDFPRSAAGGAQTWRGGAHHPQLDPLSIPPWPISPHAKMMSWSENVGKSVALLLRHPRGVGWARIPGPRSVAALGCSEKSRRCPVQAIHMRRITKVTPTESDSS